MPGGVDEGDFGTLIKDHDGSIKISTSIKGNTVTGQTTKTGSGAGGYSAGSAQSAAAEIAAPLVTGTVIDDWDPMLAMILAGDAW